jgi:hypothetical protein
VLPRNDPIVEINKIFPAAYHFVPVDMWVIIGIVCDAKKVGSAKNTIAKTNSDGKYPIACNNTCNTVVKLG